MDQTRWRQVEQLYHVALQKEPADREAFLHEVCAGDASLLEEVKSLLAFSGGADGYLRAVVGEAAVQAGGADTTKSSQPITNEIGAGPLRKLGRYEILEQLGKGGMGVVYRAIDPTIGRMVAIKTIMLNDEARGETSEQQARFIRESQAAGRLSHPNIVAVHDVCQEGKTSYIVMEYVYGRTLDQVMREDPALRSSTEVVRIVQECAAALDYAHSLGVVHRDIKPANIMLQVDGRVKIADFGIAKISQSSALTQTAATLGSPGYMAPEQWRGEAVTGQTDQYALATVAYALLTGRRPFESDSVASLVAMTLFEQPPAVVTFNFRLNPSIDEVLRKALAKTGEARYRTCSEFALALGMANENTAAVAVMPIASAAPLERTSNVQKWTVTALAIALLASLSAASWLY